MLKKFVRALGVLLVGFLLVACGQGGAPAATDDSGDGKVKVASSFSIITDMAEEIGGDHVTVHNFVPIGTDPHEYDPRPEDIKAMTDADVLFYNGLNLEGGKGGWLTKLANSVSFPEDKRYALCKGIEPKYLKDEAGQKETNPHAFLDPNVGITMAEALRDALVQEDPEHAEDYKKNAEKYLADLKKVEQEYEDKLGGLEGSENAFIASEFAFQYMTDRYHLNEGFIWAIDTDETGTPDQIQNAIRFVQENKPKVLFVESNVDTRPMETVSNETGVPIYNTPIFSDEIGKKGEPGDTYLKFLEHNLKHIYQGLTQGNG